MIAILRMAARNLLRAPRRTAIAVASGAGGLCVAVVIGNLARGIYDQAVGDAVRLGPGHLALHRAGYLPLHDPALDFPGADLSELLAAIPDVAAVRPRLFVPALAATGAGARAAGVIGVDSDREGRENPLLGRLAAGSPLSSSSPRAALVSSGLANALGLRPGDRLQLIAEAADGTRRELPVAVGGVLAAGLDALDDSAIYLPLAAASELAARPGRVHELAVVLRSADRGALRMARDRVSRLAAAQPGLVVSSWEESLPMLRDAIALDVLTHRLFLAVVYLIIGIGVVTTLALSVLARTRELGLLLALGAPPALLRRLVIVEAALLGAGSVVIGLACATALTAALARWGLDLSPYLREEIAYGGALFSPRLHAGWDWAETARAAAALLLVHVAAAAWPAARATSLRPADAMRFR